MFVCFRYDADAETDEGGGRIQNDNKRAQLLFWCLCTEPVCNGDICSLVLMIVYKYPYLIYRDI